MVQNRNKLVELFISNIANSIIHEILEKATFQDELIKKYDKELLNSLEIAKRYREKINPKTLPLPIKDINYIKHKIINKVKSELLLRISKGYTNINLNLIEQLTNKYLKETNIL
ncbi:MAG: hypothetical protein AABW67_01100 [Nanoarchaeota archaeon]